MLIFYILFTLGISVLNAWSCGKSWNDTRIAGGWQHFLNWCGATMSAVGFTWVYLIIVALAAGPGGFNKLSEHRIEQLVSLGYLAVIIPCIGSGIAITIQSWAHFWRNRTFGNAAVAGYNTWADLHNMYTAAHEIPSMLDNVGDLFKAGKDEDDAKSGLVIALALLAICAGMLTTAIIIRTVAANAARDVAWKAAME